jgi:adenylate cyclase
MIEKSLQRRLAAILAADVVGFSRLAGIDEDRTLARLRALRSDLVDPTVSVHNGRVVKRTGDGVIVEFRSVVEAVRCAVEIQSSMLDRNAGLQPNNRIEFRIGIHLGDVVEEVDGDLMGEGVNIAARLEGVAAAGAICLSEDAYRQVRSRLEISAQDLGQTQLKNIAEPIRIYSLRVGSSQVNTAPSKTELSASEGDPRTSDRTSIAVLPFQNNSGDPEQEYFSDGISEDLITDLSKLSGLRIISRNAAFAFKGRITRAEAIAKELGVNFILEGSVRKAGQRVRITTQLVNGSSGEQVWAERYDRELSDIFAVQDEITHTIIEQLRVTLLPEEKVAVELRGTSNAEAYQLLLMARQYRYSNTIADTRLVLRLAQRAVEIDRNYAEAWALVATCQIALQEMTGNGDSGLVAAERALELDSTLATAHATKGRVLCGMGRYQEALAAHQESLRLNPESYEVRFLYGRTCTEMGRAEEAILHHEKAAALSESDFLPLAMVIQSYKDLGLYSEAADASRRALTRIERAIARRPDDTSALYHGSSVLAELGEKDRAVDWANRAILLAPDESRGVYLLACTFALLGESEKAIEYLERALTTMHPGFVAWAKNDSDLTSLHNEPRYIGLIRRLEEVS